MLFQKYYKISGESLIYSVFVPYIFHPYEHKEILFLSMFLLHFVPVCLTFLIVVLMAVLSCQIENLLINSNNNVQ